MRAHLFSLLLLIFVCPLAATAQSVIETESTAVFDDKGFIFTLALENVSVSGQTPAHLELLGTAGNILASRSNSVKLTAGKQLLKFQVPIDVAKRPSQDNIAWYRLKYRIGAAEGIMSLSQMLRDLFELRIIAADNVLSGMTYRVRVRAINPFSDMPMAGVSVEAAASLDLEGDDDKKLKLAGTGQTDTDGFAVIDLTIPVGPKLDGDGEIKVVGQKDGIVREATEDLNAAKGDTQFLLMTDKPIYQPEQTMSIRGILLKGIESKTVLPNSEVEFRVTDEDDTVLYREKVSTLR